MQRQTVVKLVVVHKVLPDTVDNQMYEFVLFVEEQCDCEVTNLLLRVFGGRDEVYCFEMPEVYIPAQDVDVQKFANVFLLLVAIEAAVSELLPAMSRQRLSFSRSPTWCTHRMLANSLLILFSSSSRARALRKSAIKDTSPRIVGTSPELELRLNSPPLPDAAAIFADTDIVGIVRGLQPPRK
jgi:hypothetical protein